MTQASRVPFVVVTAALFVMLVDGNLPTPLYALYKQEFGFSSTVLTLIFAVYMIALVPSLMLFGQLSDQIGRRRVLLGALGVAAIGLVLLAAAHGTVWLFAGRFAQGVALGGFAGTAAAALVELEPSGDSGNAALATVLGQSGGSATGPLLAGILAQYAPAPRVLPYLVGLALTVVVGVALRRIPDEGGRGGRWRPQRPSVPAEIRVPFVRAGLTGAAVWSVGGLFLSVVPSYTRDELGTSNLALLGGIAAAMLASACAVQAVSMRGGLAPRTAQTAGLIILILGLAALVLVLEWTSLVVVFAAAVLSGAGLGLGYVGSQAEINQLAPPGRRGEVTAAYLTCVYCGVAAVSITAGILGDLFSLATAVAVLAAVVAVTAAGTAVWHLSDREPALVG